MELVLTSECQGRDRSVSTSAEPGFCHSDSCHFRQSLMVQRQFLPFAAHTCTLASLIFSTNSKGGHRPLRSTGPDSPGAGCNKGQTWGEGVDPLIGPKASTPSRESHLRDHFTVFLPSKFSSILQQIYSPKVHR